MSKITKTIDGHIYSLNTVKTNKRAANQAAKKLRRSNHLARVLPRSIAVGNGYYKAGYAVWVS
jgi:hypothetical protein